MLYVSPFISLIHFHVLVLMEHYFVKRGNIFHICVIWRSPRLLFASSSPTLVQCAHRIHDSYVTSVLYKQGSLPLNNKANRRLFSSDYEVLTIANVLY